MGSIEISSNNGIDKLEARLRRLAAEKSRVLAILDKYGQDGVTALRQATPERTGETAAAWSYKVTADKNGYKLSFTNDHKHEYAHVVILIQYGHGTGTGGYVHGRDFINPVLKPIFAQVKKDVLKEVTSA